MPPSFSTVLITGASSGLGAALALALARSHPGIHLILLGRAQDRLDQTAQRCESHGATVRSAAVDITDRAFLDRWLVDVDAATPIDLVIANAGISGGTAGTPPATGGPGEAEAAWSWETAAQTRAIFATNIDGVANTVLPLIPRMLRRGRGQIAIMASLAGYRGLPGTPAYCASKAAVKVWGESLRATLATGGVGVSVICPGFVATPLTAGNRFRMPFLMSDEKAARIILRGLMRNRGRIAFPWPMAAGVALLAALPDGLAGWLARRISPRDAKPPVPEASVPR